MASRAFRAWTPGGWCVIGQTPRQLIDLDRTPLVAYAPGDTFRFFPISPDEWSSYAGGLACVSQDLPS